MAHFGYLSDTDDSAVDELISQVQELSVLEQVSKINSSGFDDSLLPADLETRFRKLKSFPVSNHRNQTVEHIDRLKSLSCPKSDVGNHGAPFSDGKGEKFSVKNHLPDARVGVVKESQSGYASSSLNWSTSSVEEEILSPNPWGKSGSRKKSENTPACERKPEKKMSSKSRSRHGSNGSPFSSSYSFMDSRAPPLKAGCFWCSPKKVSKKESNENWSPTWGRNDDELLANLNFVSVKQQKRILKNAIRLEEKISRNAKEIAKLAKASMGKDGSSWN